MTLRPIDNVLGRVEFSERRGDGSWMLKCPAHDDRRASLHLTETSDGVVLIKCYAGCDTSLTDRWNHQDYDDVDAKFPS